VRLYQDTTVPAVPSASPSGAPGRWSATPPITLSGGGSGGSSFAIDGGATQPGRRPEVDLNVEALPAGRLHLPHDLTPTPERNTAP
jgi:hypothetical protein